MYHILNKQFLFRFVFYSNHEMRDYAMHVQVFSRSLRFFFIISTRSEGTYFFNNIAIKSITFFYEKIFFDMKWNFNMLEKKRSNTYKFAHGAIFVPDALIFNYVYFFS